jgi:prolipoprotein diacylglyceryltransferase
LNWFDFTAPAFFLGLGIGRIGEILAGEYSGVETSSRIAHGFLSISVFNTPFFEAILCFFLFIFGLALYKQKKSESGHNVLILFSIYSIVRFIIDFGRIESKIILNLSLGQIISLVIFIFSVILLIREKNNKMKRDPSTSPTKLGRSG